MPMAAAAITNCDRATSDGSPSVSTLKNPNSESRSPVAKTNCETCCSANIPVTAARIPAPDSMVTYSRTLPRGIPAAEVSPSITSQHSASDCASATFGSLIALTLGCTAALRSSKSKPFEY